MWASNQIPVRDRAKVIRDARDYALINGMVLRYDHMTNDNCVAHIPFTLFPSPFPRKLYQECLLVQPVVNKLMLKIANDTAFINDTLRPLAQVDDFTKNLLDINDAVQREGLAQSTICCINRADYMLDTVSNSSPGQLRLRQVEVNAIASSMSAHSYRASRLQDFLMTKYGIKTPNNTNLPDNTSLDLVAGGLIDAFDSYGKSSAMILLINEERSMNFSDQVAIELEVSRMRPDVKFIRRAFVSLPNIIKLGPNKELLVEDSIEIAVVYFRYCYDPSNYNFDQAWNVRLLLERSRAIKCPSINFHLSGAKKFQQVLNNQAKLERYLESEEAKQLEGFFCKFWSFEDNSDLGEGYRTALDESNRLVLKPQREGGGHNIFGKDINPFVRKIVKTEERFQYILMEYIEGPKEKNWILLQQDDERTDSERMNKCDQLVSELGIFGSILADTNTLQVESNKSAGYLVRSKKFGTNEGGVATGYAGISSLILVDDFDAVDDFSLYYANSVN